MEKRRLFLDEYVRDLMRRRAEEPRTEDLENEYYARRGQGLTSPASELPKEELKLQQMNIMGQNMMRIAASVPERKKPLLLRRFFKHKRNQVVEVYSKHGGDALRTLGKVNAIGRDFVTLTTLSRRVWLPFASIESANAPFGLPDVPSSHQHLVIDEELRRKLITRFGETVAKRDVLIQQFFEESLLTHLQTRRGTRVEVLVRDGSRVKGRVEACENGVLELRSWRTGAAVRVEEIAMVRTMRWWQWLPIFQKRF